MGLHISVCNTGKGYPLKTKVWALLLGTNHSSKKKNDEKTSSLKKVTLPKQSVIFWEEYHFCFLLLLQEPIHSLFFMYFCVQSFSWSRDDWSDKCSGKKNSSSQLRQKRENLGRFHHCYENMNKFSALSVLFIFSKSQTNLVTEIRHAQYQFNKCVCLCV